MTWTTFLTRRTGRRRCSDSSPTRASGTGTIRFTGSNGIRRIVGRLCKRWPMLQRFRAGEPSLLGLAAGRVLLSDSPASCPKAERSLRQIQAAIEGLNAVSLGTGERASGSIAKLFRPRPTFCESFFQSSRDRKQVAIVVPRC